MTIEGNISSVLPPESGLNYAPDSQDLAAFTYSGSGTIVALPTTGYNVYYTALGTGIGSGNKANAVWIDAEQTQYQQGYRIDISDVRDVLNIGDSVKIGSTTYTVKRKVEPEIDPVNVKYVGFKDISETPLEIHLNAPRLYSFEISINISELNT